MSHRIAILFLLVFIALFKTITAEAAFQDPVQATLFTEVDGIQPSRPFWVGIRLQLDDTWHAYWKNPGDTGMAPIVQWDFPEGFQAGPIQWPTPKKFSTNGALGFGYDKEVILLAEISPPSTIADPVHLGADLKWVVCDDSSCLPGGAQVTVTVPMTTSTPSLQHQELFSKARSSLPKQPKNMQAEMKDDLITINIDSIDAIHSVQFFPEYMGQIDETVDPVVTTSGIILKGGDAFEPPLKGVLTLSRDETVESYEIDLAITSSKQHAIAANLEEIRTPATSTVSRIGIVSALSLAFLGGLMLNLMPCVLPVISFKVLSFIKMAQQSRALIFKHGVAFSLGVLVSFWILAGALLILQAYGSALGWGFQLQQPLFVAILASVILIFGLSLFGLFEIGTSLASLAGQAQTSTSSTGLGASFFSGVLATALATPCSGPLLGPAIGIAVTLPPVLSMLVFTALGFGMSFPYLLLGTFPALLRFMPKPGNWMITFKEMMGFIMLATALWLISVFGSQTGATAVSLLLVGFFFLSFGCWIYGKWGTPIKKKVVRLGSYTLTSFFLIVGGYIMYTASTIPSDQHMAKLSSGWENFSPKKIEELRQKGIPVFVDFTAKWCLSCQTNHLSLMADSVTKKFDALEIVRMKADWTKSDPVITEELRKFGRNSVPLYLLYGTDPTEPPTILPQILTPGVVLNYLDMLEKKVIASTD